MVNLVKTMNIKKTGIHTTKNNIHARAFYQSFSYVVSEIGNYTIADGIKKLDTFFQEIHFLFKNIMMLFLKQYIILKHIKCLHKLNRKMSI